MDSLLNIKPGLLIWTIINFLIFLFILIKFGGKAIINGLKAREDKINRAIESAEKANEEAQKLLKESRSKLDSAREEMAAIVNKGREQAEAQVRKAAEEADKVKRQKLDEAVKEIENSKQAALKELRSEVAGLVIEATEKILDEKLDKDKHTKLIESYLDKVPKN
ncbi:MAG: F0F1 ATP synthase subunit B [Candidatus Kapaibacterium sp.]